MIALCFALKKLYREGTILEWPLRDLVAAVSVGFVNGKPVLDLNYEKDKDAETDFNFVMTGRGKFVEIQGTAEKVPFSDRDFTTMSSLAKGGIRTIIQKQKQAIGKIP